MKTKKKHFPYIHGFSEIEQARLRKQAEFAEHIVYQDINFSEAKNIVEIGSGVGAQTAILLRRYPNTKITCIEYNDVQIKAASKYLASLAYAKGRYEIVKMDATDLDFEAGSFDAAFVCWVLEHISDPNRLLAEARRVLKPGALIVCTEVMNSSFFLDPYSPNLWKYWMSFNDFQHEQAGDPFVGAKLGNLLQRQGYVDISTKVKIMHYDNRHPQKRRSAIREWKELLLSACENLKAAGKVDEEVIEGMKKELKSVELDPNAVFFNAFMQAQACV